MAVRTKMPHELQPDQPSRANKLAAKRKPPGVWMHIIGMLKLPTCLRRYVVQIWGMYCTAARMAAMTPSVLAQVGRCSLATVERIPVMTMTARPCSRVNDATRSAVCHLG